MYTRLDGVHDLYPLPGRFLGHFAEKISRNSLIVPVCDPISQSLDGLWQKDHSVLRIPCREEEYLEGRGTYRTLGFAVMHRGGVALPDPPI